MKTLIKILFFLLPALAFSAVDSGNMLSFDGVDDVATVTDSGALNLIDNLSQVYTLEAWAKLNSLTADPRILQRKDSFVLYVDDTNDRVIFASRSGTQPQIVSANWSIVTNRWYHIAVRRRQESPGVYRTNLYLNGNVCASTSTHADFQLAASGEPVLFGNSQTGTSPLHGRLDEVRFWTIARDAADIDLFKGASLTGTEDNLLACFTFDEPLGTQIFGDLTGEGLAAVRGTDGSAEAQDPAHVASSAPIGYKLIKPNIGPLVAGDTLTYKWAVDANVDTVSLLFWRQDKHEWDYIVTKTVNDGSYQSFVPGFPTPASFTLFRVMNTQDDTLFDDSDNNIIITDPPNWKREIVFEAEDADTLIPPMQIITRGKAFFCEAIYSDRDRTGRAVYNFTVAKGGLYVIWGRMCAPGGTRNSYFVSVDDGPDLLWDLEKRWATWRWQIVSDRGVNGLPPSIADVDPVIVSLTAGNHKIAFKTRENYTELDRILLTNDLRRSPYEAPSQWIQLLDPYDSGQVPWGEPLEIKWTSANISPTVTIELSFDLGATYPITIVKGTANDGSYFWDVPNYGKKYGFLRISNGNGGHCPWDVSYMRFKFIAPEPKLTVISPNGGEVLTGETVHDIVWKSLVFTGNTNIDASYDNGVSWTTLATNQPDSGQFAWTVPNISTTTALIKIYDSADGVPADTSDAVFTIVPNIPPEVLTVVFPNGGENLIAGRNYDIWWDSEAYAGSVKIDLSLNNGQTWISLATNQPDSGTFLWLIPEIVSDSALIRIYDPADNSPIDQSNAVFSIMSSGTVQDYALYFDGSNDYVEVPNDASLNVVNNFTIEFWIKTSVPLQNNTRVLEKGSWDEYSMSFYSNTGKMCGALRITLEPGKSKMSNVVGPSATVFSADVWYHIAATYDGASARIYVNGVLERTKAAIVSPRSLLGDLIIGAVKHPEGIDSYLNATLDELRIWNAARTVAQINASMFAELTGAEAGLAAYYNFNEGSGQVLGDLSANANDGRLGATDATDVSDPAWVISDRPAAPGPSMAHASVSQSMTDDIQLMPLPTKFDLQQNYPNPFNGGTTIPFTIPENETAVNVVVDIYDLQGRIIKVLVNNTCNAGFHQIYWNGTTAEGNMAASGIYFYRIKAGHYAATKRMLYLK